MSKYFFDRVTSDRAEYDYHGRAFSSPEYARQLAELIALDLEIEPDGRWSGWFVDVRDAYGERFFTIPVREPELACA
jgi:hypothetical protein